MKKIIFSCYLSFALLFATKAQTVYSNYTDGKVYVKFAPGYLKNISKEDPKNIPLAKLDFLKDLFSRYGVTKVYKPFYQASDDAVLPHILRVEFTQIKLVESLITELQRVTGVEYAEKVSLNKTDAVPNDPLFATASGSTHLNQINAQNAWNVFNGGSNITVAIVDNAVMWTHVDLAANTYTNALEASGTTGVDDDGNGYIDDKNGYDVANMDGVTTSTDLAQDHGTHCAGIAGAVNNNSVGIGSIGWNIKIIPVKTSFDNSGPSSVNFGYEGIIYAVKAKAKIISCSWGGSGFSSTEQSVINYAWNRGSIVMASAGNANTSTQNYPGAYANVYCVAAVNPSNIKSSYSNYGTWIDISAPGDAILSTVPYTPTATAVYVNKSGTSMATPLVAGLAALMLSKSPNMTRTDVLNCISSTAVNIYTIGGNSAFVTGNQLGAGRIEAFAAMNCAATYSALPPVANFYAFLPSTCPNTNIPFIDSSLYAPTSWAWVFQGGTPATSTSSNPSVQWATAGTYSVSLTVSNGNGNNTKTKLSYITVSGPTALPFSEGFQATTFLPTNWVANNIYNDVIYWQRVTTAGGFGTSTACAMFNNYSYNAPGERDEMRSPKFDFTNVATARLRFDVAYARYNSTFSDTLEVKASANCGTSWTSIYTVGGTSLSTRSDMTGFFTPTSSQWRRDTIDVSPSTAGQAFVQFSFLNRGNYGQPIYLDNINLVFPNPTLSVIHSATVCSGASVSFSNTSLSAANYTWNFQGASPAVSTSSSPAVSYASPGTYTLSLFGVNGTSTASITRTITVTSTPTVSSASASVCSGNSLTLSAVGANSYIWYSTSGAIGTSSSVVVNPTASAVYTVIGTSGVCTSQGLYNTNVTPNPTVTVTSQTICNGSSAILTASGASAYLWNTSSTSNSISVTPSVSSNYSVTGTSAGCSDSKTASVTIVPQVTVNVSSNPSAKCANESATLTASGANTYTWNTGSTTSIIVVSPSVSTTYTVSGSNGFCSTTNQTTVTIVATPTLTISSSATGTICSGATISLSVSGANTYTWSNGSNASNTTVSPTISTTYTVIGSNPGCSNSLTVSVSVGASSIAVSINTSPSAICAGSSATLTGNGATSYSWSNGSNNSSIVVSPTVTSNYTLNGSTGACTGNTITTLVVSQAPVSILSTSNALCVTACNGIINASSTGGAAPFSYSISNSSCITLPCTSLCPGLYTLYTTNSAGCQSSNIFSIASPAALQSTFSFTNAACSTCPNGAITANITGGTAPYSYTWSPSGGNAASAVELLPGCYTVTISDANGCITTSSVCVSSGTGIKTTSLENALSIYPNPAAKEVHINYEGHNFDLNVYSNLGQLILSKTKVQNSCELDLEAYSKGIYFIEVISNEQKVVKKLILN
jgi:serine protease